MIINSGAKNFDPIVSVELGRVIRLISSKRHSRLNVIYEADYMRVNVD